MAVTVTGRLSSAAGTTPSGPDIEPGTVDVALCGYGSQVPRAPNSTMYANLTDLSFPVDSNGGFSFDVYGNNEIKPDGTYYTVTVRNSNGDIAQVNAYIFLEGTNYNLNSTAPYDPAQPPPPIPPLIGNQLYIVTYGTPSNFPCDQATAFSLTLTGDAEGIFQNIQPGNIYTFIIIQDATGGHQFWWDGAMTMNSSLVCKIPNSITIQSYVADQNSMLYPIGPATWYTP